MAKRIYFKSYKVILDTLEVFYKGYFDNWATSNLVSTINGGLGSATLTIPRKVDDYGEGEDVGLNNRVDIWVYDDDKPTGVLIYSGFMYDIPKRLGFNETIEINVSGAITKLESAIYQSTTLGFRESIAATDLSNIYKKIIDQFRANNPAININYTATSIPSVGVSRAIEFNNDTYLDCIKAVSRLLPANYYWFLDAKSTFHLKQYATKPKHLFYYGKHIVDIKDTVTLAGMTNELLLWNGLSSTNPNYLARLYINSQSVADFGRFTKKKIDGRFTTLAAANTYGNNVIAQASFPIRTVTVTIVDNNFGRGYDIESIQPGDTFRIMNGKENMPMMIVSKIVYEYSQIVITAQDIRQTPDRTNFDLRKDVEQGQYITSGPAVYTQ